MLTNAEVFFYRFSILIIFSCFPCSERGICHCIKYVELAEDFIYVSSLKYVCAIFALY